MKDFNDRQFLQWKTSKKDYFLNERLDSNGGLRKTWWLDERLAWRGLQKLRKTSFFFFNERLRCQGKTHFWKTCFFFFNLTILLSNSRWVEVSFNNIWKQITYDGHGTIAKISFVNERHSSRRKTIWVGIQMKSVYISGCRRTNLVLMQIKTYKWHTYFLLKDSTESFFFKKWKTFCLDVQRFLCTLWFWDWKDLGLFVGCM